MARLSIPKRPRNAKQRKIKQQTAILPAHKVIPRQSDGKPAIHGLIEYVINGSEIARDQLTLNLLTEAADARRDAIEAMERWHDIGTRLEAIRLVREHFPAAPRNIPAKRIIHALPAKTGGRR